MRNGFILKMPYFPSNWLPLGMGEETGRGFSFIYYLFFLFLFLSVLNLSRITHILGSVYHHMVDVLIHWHLLLTAPHMTSGKKKS